MRKSGFTIAEFIICIMIMFVVMGALVTVPLKKAKTTKHVQFKNGEIICDCNNTTNRFSGNLGSSPYCDFMIDNATGQNEFFTIQLVGGGAAGSSGTAGNASMPPIGGDAGESKMVNYPSMNGNYRIVLGVGGKASGNNRNGGNTVLYKQTDTSWELVEFAAGGIGSEEVIDVSEVTAGVDLSLGARPDFGIDGALVCGSGGNANQDGIMGGAIIRW